MMMGLCCPNCVGEIKEKNLVRHLEECSVGPVPFEEVKLTCGQCSFRSSKERIHLMINHCAATRHDPRKVQFDWKDFAELETTRTVDLLQIGVSIKQASSEAYSEFEQETKKSNGDCSFDDLNLSRAIKPIEEPWISNNVRCYGDSFPQENAYDTNEKKTVTKAKKRAHVEGKSSQRGRQSMLSKEVMKCVQCPEARIRFPKEILHHVAAHQPPLKPLKCSACDYGGSLKYRFTKHLKRHTDENAVITANVDEELVETLRKRVLESHPLIQDWSQICNFSIEGLKNVFE